MIERELEPEVMDTLVDTIAYETMDNYTPLKAVLDDYLATGPMGNSVLDIGTGPGDLAVMLAEADEHVLVTGIDMAETMIELAHSKVNKAALSERIHLIKADAKHLPFDPEGFDSVISNTIMHHIPQPSEMLLEAWRVLKPGGRLYIRDLFRPDTEEELHAIVDRHAAEATDEQRQLLSQSLRAALTPEECRELLIGLNIPAEVTVDSDRHMTIRCNSK